MKQIEKWASEYMRTFPTHKHTGEDTLRGAFNAGAEKMREEIINYFQNKTVQSKIEDRLYHTINDIKYLINKIGRDETD